MIHNKELFNKKIDVSANETQVLKLLENHNIRETGKISKPTKDIWFKYYHYIMFFAIGERLYFKYIPKNFVIAEQPLDNIDLKQLKELLKQS